MQPSTISRFIECTPGVAGGKPRIAGTRVRVQDIVGLYEIRGLTPDEIVAGSPHLNLAQVHAALAYYYENREAINQNIRDDETFVERLRAGLIEGMDADSISS